MPVTPTLSHYMKLSSPGSLLRTQNKCQSPETITPTEIKHSDFHRSTFPKNIQFPFVTLKLYKFFFLMPHFDILKPAYFWKSNISVFDLLKYNLPFNVVSLKLANGKAVTFSHTSKFKLQVVCFYFPFFERVRVGVREGRVPTVTHGDCPQSLQNIRLCSLGALPSSL